MSYQRLSTSKRNELIADFNEGKIDPDFEVIPSKTVKGKYTIRKRKVSLPADEEPQEENNQVDEEAEEVEVQQEQPQTLDLAPIKHDKMTEYLLDYQMAMNKLMIEQMKALRQNNKYMLYKQKKYKERQNKIHDIFDSIAKTRNLSNEAEEPEQEEVEEPVEETPQPKRNTNYFQNDYSIPKQEIESEEEDEQTQEIPEKEYENDYERDLDQMAGVPTYVIQSRRSKIKSFI